MIYTSNWELHFKVKKRDFINQFETMFVLLLPIIGRCTKVWGVTLMRVFTEKIGCSKYVKIMYEKPRLI